MFLHKVGVVFFFFFPPCKKGGLTGFEPFSGVVMLSLSVNNEGFLLTDDEEKLLQIQQHFLKHMRSGTIGCWIESFKLRKGYS